MDGPTGAAPRSSRTARRSVSLATGAPDPSARATRDEAAEAGGRTARARSAASGTPDGDTAPRRPYEGCEEWGGAAPSEGAGAGGAHGPGAEPAGADGGTDGRTEVPGPEGEAGRAGRAGARNGAEGGRARGARTPAHQRAGDAEEARGGALTVGAARAGALLERQLTLARTRAHTAALQALGSSRFHAVADTVALLASEVPLDEATAGRPAGQVLPPLAELANRRLIEAVEALPLGRAGHPYNAEALVHGLAATPAADAPPASDRQDAPWHQVRRLVRMRRYALEVLDLMAGAPSAADGEPSQATRLRAAGQALERHRDAAEAAAAAAAAARTPRIAPATAYALGVLHADQRHEVEAARFAFGRTWRRVAGQTS
ncbi:CHAD domain-containing protein [Streptomyces sp. NPDC019937]|uniref:CHAD domain-containing protein n=1 Tax=Streptomyces sp. NPDC019937 TaxID=3154787 RepID=UPI0033D09483